LSALGSHLARAHEFSPGRREARTSRASQLLSLAVARGTDYHSSRWAMGLGCGGTMVDGDS
jgi:hypothetical protein